MSDKLTIPRECFLSLLDEAAWSIDEDTDANDQRRTVHHLVVDDHMLRDLAAALGIPMPDGISTEDALIEALAEPPAAEVA